MNAEEIHVGTLVVQPSRPDWGPGKVVKVADNRVYVVWRDLPDREAKLMVASSVMRAPEQADPILDNLPPLREKDGKLVLPAARITLKHAVYS
jgi:hypothetical protein